MPRSKAMPASFFLACALAALVCLLPARPVSAQAPLAFGVLHSFGGADPVTGSPDGGYLYSGLTAGGDGFLYGVTFSGGASGRGTIFKMRLDGSGYQKLHDFSPLSSFAPYGNSDGADPYGTLLPGGDGFFYGTAEGGGTNDNGTLFKIRADGSGFVAIHSFSAADTSGHNADGQVPYNGLTSGGDGFFYGAADHGGANGNGTIFQVNSDGSVFNTLHSFAADDSEGYSLSGALTALGGYLYGMAYGGGTHSGGTIFRLRTDGTGFLVLHPFAAATDGSSPTGGLTAGPDGLLYGATLTDGSNGNGTLFNIQTNGSGFTVIHTFSAASNRTNADGSAPQEGSLTLGPDGLLYGLAGNGGLYGSGTAFRLAPDGSDFQTLHSFSGQEDGESPHGTPLLAPDGFVYGVTLVGGLNGSGTAFRLTPAHTHLLWDTADGRASLWSIDTLGQVTVSPTYGPYDGGKWKAAALATGPDGTSHLLWAHPSDGTYAVWNITNPSKPTILPNYGPYPGWSAVALSVGSDGLDRLLWDDSQPFVFGEYSSGPASLWTLTSSGTFSYALYGPYNTWSAVALASSAGGVSHLLWHNTSGLAALWTIDGGANVGVSQNYGPFTGWQASSLAVGVQGERQMLWTHGSDGAASLWRVDALDHANIGPTYGPYSGYACVAVAADPSGTAHLLWSHPADGKVSFWSLDTASDPPGVGSSVQSLYGPYADGKNGFWFPVAASAGP